MEISNLFNGEQLAKIDKDFKEQLINENDKLVDEDVLHRKYTHLFNVLGNLQKL